MDPTIQFTAHNIRLDDGTLTRPEIGTSMDQFPRFTSARRLLDTVFPGDKSRLRLADVGCLEGGYAVEFARMGFQVVGLEVRDANIAACKYVKAHTNLPNLEFVQDNAWNLERHGMFDAVFCCGLLYHLDQPKRFLEMLARVTRKCVILQTHFAIGNGPGSPSEGSVRSFLKWPFARFTGRNDAGNGKYSLSNLAENEGLPGRWYAEFAEGETEKKRAAARWASWDNHRSFWIQREYLLDAIQRAGFDTVMEQFDELRPGIAESMLRGFYHESSRGTFIGLKSIPG